MWCGSDLCGSKCGADALRMCHVAHVLSVMFACLALQGGDVSLGKRNAIDFLVSTGSGGPGGPAGASAGSHMEGGGGDSDKRPRHNPL